MECLRTRVQFPPPPPDLEPDPKGRVFLCPPGRLTNALRPRWYPARMASTAGIRNDDHQRTALLVVDMINPLDFEGGEALRSEEHTSELQSRENLVCRLLLEKKKMK